jgi:hypothetical protein
MPRRFPSRLVSLVLAAFLVGQPVVGCAALCLIQRHHAHAMAGMAGVTGGTACHRGVSDADHATPIQGLSPMAPAHDPVLAELPTRTISPLDVPPILPPHRPLALEPPPPRLV